MQGNDDYEDDLWKSLERTNGRIIDKIKKKVGVNQ